MFIIIHHRGGVLLSLYDPKILSNNDTLQRTSFIDSKHSYNITTIIVGAGAGGEVKADISTPLQLFFILQFKYLKFKEIIKVKVLNWK